MNMVDPEGAAALLRSASRLVTQALERLDLSEDGCAECGARHFTNRSHAKVFEQFEATPEKLAQAAARLVNEAKERVSRP